MIDGSENDVPLGAYDQYMRQVRHTPSLQDGEAERLLMEMANGQQVETARERIVAGFQPMIVKLAWRYAARCIHLDFLDLVQEGNIGLLEALQRFNLAQQEA